MNIRKSIRQLFLITLFSAIFSTAYAKPDNYQVTGPFTNKNLSIYLIHGQDKVKGENYLTLSEAMQQKKVKVHETSNVNQLSIENLSQSNHIYIQAGDIVKGGKQDRVFSTDMILEPNSGKVNIASFCVESGRWNKRGNESATEFHSSTKKLSSKELKLAARLEKNQSRVWSEVAKTQQKLTDKVGEEVKSKDSASSLQLALENKQVAKHVAEYKDKLTPVIKNKKQVIGYAFSINGKLNTADIYANQALLKKLWPKIIDAAATESVAEYKKGLSFKNPKAEAILAWMKDAEKGKKSLQDLKPGLQQETVESETDVRFETYSGKGENKKSYRKNYIKK